MLRTLRPVASITAVVAFNVAMVILAATGQGPIGATFLVVWIVGDALLCLLAVALTER